MRFPATENRVVSSIRLAPLPPPWSSSSLNRLLPVGLPTTLFRTNGSPMYPAGAAGATAGFQVRNGHGVEVTIGVKGGQKPAVTSAATQPRSTVSSMVPTPFLSMAVVVNTPYGCVMRYV